MHRLPEPPLALIVFTVGLSILGAEIAAARLLAPYFGASTVVWANTIGIVLVALSAGYWYGGRLADRNPTRTGLYRIVLLSGLLLAAVPFVADPFLGVAVEALDSISAGAFAGSLLGVTVLVATLLLAPALLAVLLALPVGTVKGETDSGERVIFEADTEYQYARVVEDVEGTRKLELNEGQAVHSVRRPDSYLTDNIWDEYMIVPFAAQDRPPGRVAILGNAAGTTARAYGHYFPQTAIDGVEIDGELTEIGRRFFDMQGRRLTTYTADARPFLRRTKQR